jgi:hypothetical protein|tara:strand:- start:324 stop:602 length:279 start_codon:yes stop_codon:yes gene_type:complete
MKKAHIKVDTEVSSSQYHDTSRVRVSAHVSEDDQIRVSSVQGDTLTISAMAGSGSQSIDVTFFLDKAMIQSFVYKVMQEHMNMNTKNEENDQ